MHASAHRATPPLDPRLAKLEMKQGDGRCPQVVLGVPGQGEHGVGLLHLRFHEGAFVRGIGSCHWLAFHLGPPARMSCRIDGRLSDHVEQPGRFAVCPAESEVSVETDTPIDTLCLMIPTQPLALLSAERGRPGARCIGQLTGMDDELLSIARDLVDEAACGFSAVASHAWRDLSEILLDHLFEHYLAPDRTKRRGLLSPETLARIHRHIEAHLGETIEIAALADVAGQSRSHFPRLFRRATGVSPHQYVVRRRLKRAVQLIRAGGPTLAEIAATTGFVDQSHLSNWMRRIYGITPGRLTP